MSSVRFLVSGKVQGVFFRASARREALRLSLHGHARNLADGSVEVVAGGSDQALHELEDWLWQGPSTASVEDVTREEYDGEVREGFLIF